MSDRLSGGLPVRPRRNGAAGAGWCEEDAWLPGLAEPVADHPHFPKLVSEIRTMRDRDAWLNGERTAVRLSPPPCPPRSAPEPHSPLLAVLLIGIAIGWLTTLLMVQPQTTDRLDAAASSSPAERSADRRRPAPDVLRSGLLGAGRAQANETLEPAPTAPAPDATAPPSPDRPLEAAIEVIKQGRPAAPRPDPQPAGLDGALARALYELGQRQQAAGNVEAALASYKRSAGLDPDHAQTYYDWGWLLQQAGDVAGAMDKYRATIERAPGHAFAHYNMGYLLQSAGDVTGAQIIYENAVAAGAANAATLYNLGWLMQKAGDDASAMQHYEASLEEKPDHTLANYNLGYLHERRGDLSLAAEHYRRALESDPSLTTAAERLAALQR